MAVEVKVRISPRMFREDAEALRGWLEQTYPVRWEERPDPDHGDSLAVADVVLVALFTGMGEEFGKAAVSAVRAKLKELAERYRADDLPAQETSFAPVPEAADGPDAGGATGGASGADDDTH